MQIKKNLENALVSNINSHIEILKLENKNKKAINLIHKSIKSGGKILICGNGGSASDAQHLVAEFLVRLRPNVNRKPIAAMTLAQDTSTITACGNDYSFDEIFKRNFEALSKKSVRKRRKMFLRGL